MRERKSKWKYFCHRKKKQQNRKLNLCEKTGNFVDNKLKTNSQDKKNQNSNSNCQKCPKLS